VTLALDLRRFAAKAGGLADNQVRAICFELAKRIDEKTPVDSGRLRGNWQATIGAPATGEINRTGSALAANMAAIRDAPGKVFYYVNNLPYAAVAEFGQWGNGPYSTVKTTRDGYSVQAPYGMVRVTINKLQRAFG
jgi:hypothetical protein